MRKPKVLFLCTGNRARSQMAEALLRRHAGDRFEIHSAGLEPEEIHPMTIQVMEEAGFDMSDHEPKGLDQFLGKTHFGYLITVCQNAEEKCPTFPGVGNRIFWPVGDPVAFEGPEEEKLNAFRAARDELEERIQTWLEDFDE